MSKNTAMISKPNGPCSPQHSCQTCGGCLLFPCLVTANGVHPKPTLDFGFKLPNGFTVVDYRDMPGKTGVVLARRGAEWATWALNPERPESTVSGHYFTDLLDAVVDFEHRSSHS